MTKSKCWLLFKTQMKNEFGRSLKSKGRKITSFAVGLVILMIAFYAYMLAYGLGSMGMEEVIPSYGVAITGLITLFFTALKTNGVLFAYKEYDMMMSFPVKTSTVIASRFLTMYVLNLLQDHFTDRMDLAHIQIFRKLSHSHRQHQNRKCGGNGNHCNHRVCIFKSG